jgi:hypothetical protein
MTAKKICDMFKYTIHYDNSFRFRDLMIVSRHYHPDTDGHRVGDLIFSPCTEGNRVHITTIAHRIQMNIGDVVFAFSRGGSPRGKLRVVPRLLGSGPRVMKLGGNDCVVWSHGLLIDLYDSHKMTWAEWYQSHTLHRYDSGLPVLTSRGELLGVNTSASLFSYVRGHFKDGDTNLDFKVDISDLAVLAENYGEETDQGSFAGDFNGDGIVDVGDLSVLTANYGERIDA